MKNEPIIAYDHLQEENEKSAAEQHSSAEHKMNWRAFVHPVAITIEIIAIIAMAIFMIQEMFR